MKGLIKTGVLGAATAASLCISVPAQAAMGCWNPTQVAAAQVRDLQSRLMVATLRCQAMGMDISAAYNRFIGANRTTIQGANAVLLAQFRNGFGSQAQTQYDRFATSLANLYGADATDRAVCAETSALADEAADAAGDVNALVAINGRLGFSSALPGGECRMSFAAAGGN
jgi:hypothetical protein